MHWLIHRCLYSSMHPHPTAFCVSLGEAIDEVLEALSGQRDVIEAYYSTFNILEALLVIARADEGDVESKSTRLRKPWSRGHFNYGDEPSESR